MNEIPQVDEVLASHSGDSSVREWNSEHSVWLNPGDCIVRAKDGTSSIRGTVDQGTEGIKAFLCRFDSKGGFIDVMAFTPDGE